MNQFDAWFTLKGYESPWDIRSLAFRAIQFYVPAHPSKYQRILNQVPPPAAPSFYLEIFYTVVVYLSVKYVIIFFSFIGVISSIY